MDTFSLGLSPRGHLTLVPDDDAALIDASLLARMQAALERGSGHVLVLLGVDAAGTVLPPGLGYWREFGARYVTEVCSGAVAPLTGEELEPMALAAPPMMGVEYLTEQVLGALWAELDMAFSVELAEAKCELQEFLRRRNPAWNLVGRVHFNLAENRKDDGSPFAFLATYTTRLSAQAKAQHVPLGNALREYAGAANKTRLLSLLLPVQRAAECCGWLKAMVDGGEIFHPLRWSSGEALQLLRDAQKLEAAGVVVRMPAAWRGNRPPRARVTGTVGGKPPSGIGKDALLDFHAEVTLDGEPLTEVEIGMLLAQSDGLALVRGQWIEVNGGQLRSMLERFEEVERTANEEGLGFAEAMRLLAGAGVTDEAAAESADWTQVVAGPWLAETLQGLRSPQGLAQVEPGGELKATLRPYQQTGVRWLYLLANLGLGACLADDMGLGKTIQVLSLLLILKRAKPQPSLLVVPASLLGNWAAEIERFTPGLKYLVVHPSAMAAGDLRAFPKDLMEGVDVVLTSYSTVLRVPWLSEVEWRMAVLDEAQAIKNPGAQQTRAVKKLKAGARLAMTGTPVENRLGDLWSIFDFVNPGLLGTAKEFGKFTKRLSNAEHPSYRPLRELVRPYILRRLKTDKTVIDDLPDKLEVKTFCPLSRKQAALYEQAVKDLAGQLNTAAGIQRKGLVLAFLMRFKQICNHPSQWLSDGGWTEEESGKWARLRDIAEVVASKQEKMLVFTQFREVTTPLAGFLSSIFGKPGLVLHGDTEVKKRQDLVRRFQQDESIGFFVLSLKAGGAGLNLTAASHVVHFDRWWNPAVENQATDRAFRIGQTKNVLVHKFVCRGTVEEKIDEMIEAKRRLSGDLLEGGADVLLTEMKDDDLLKLVALDLNKALKEG